MSTHIDDGLSNYLLIATRCFINMILILILFVVLVWNFFLFPVAVKKWKRIVMKQNQLKYVSTDYYMLGLTFTCQKIFYTCD